MTISGPTNIQASPNTHAGMVAPVSVTQGWATAISAGGPAVQDAATITNPTTQITAATRVLLRRGGVGTSLVLRLAYDDGLTSITNPVVKVFGRTGNDVWQVLRNKAGGLTTTLTTAATDTTDGTLLYTNPAFDTEAIDCLGCDEILVGVETALAGTGTTSNAVIQAKII